MHPKRFTFLMENFLGHVPFAQNLQKAFANQKLAEIEWCLLDFDPTNPIAKIPQIRDNWTLRGSYKAQRSINRQRKQGRPADLYFFHTQSIALTAGLARKHAPVVISLDATPLNYDRVGVAYGHRSKNKYVEKVKLGLNRHVFHSATFLITWSEWARQSLIEDYSIAANKVEVVPPGTDLAFWKGAMNNSKPSEEDGKIRLLFVGGDFERKGGRLLYDVFRRNFADKCELHLITKGQVEESPGVFVHRNINPNSPEIQALFGATDIFILPTEGDCLPVAITEAMASGLPVISTRMGAIEEAVLPGFNGYLIEPGDSERLVQALDRLVSDKALRQEMGQRGRERAEKYFDGAKNAGRILEICIALAERRNVKTITPEAEKTEITTV
ncbi:MAG TPA: glycosyltransferase family 4 protein [Chloroflexia bacterium]|nr:glycosyltransferase family 4 protein [Chloroflexia bacterium]